MKILITLLLIGTLTLGCTQKSKAQYYFTIKTARWNANKKPLIIYRSIDSTTILKWDDSSAYYKAYTYFYLNILINKRMKSSRYMKFNIQFSLLNWKREDVTYILSEKTEDNIIKLVHKNVSAKDIPLLYHKNVGPDIMP
jgi:hypothetical protein